MPQPLSILFGALFTALTAWASGALLFAKLGLTLKRGEQFVLEFLAGSACLSAAVFFLCTVHGAKASVFLPLGILVIGAAAFALRRREPLERFPPFALAWRWALAAVFLSFGYYYLMTAMAPEVSADGTAYHLAIVAQYQRACGFVPITTNMYANLSEGVEMLFLFAFVFGRHSAAATLHLLFLPALAFVVLNYGRRVGMPGAGAVAAIIVYTCPVIGSDASTAYIDVALAAIVFSVFYLVQIWVSARNQALLVPIAMLAGFAYGAKYTALVALPYALTIIIWKSRRASFRPVFIVCTAAALWILPWMIKNEIVVHNPVSPMANALFPNPYVHVSLERYWRASLRSYGLKNHWAWPLEVTVRGETLGGLLGPVFLLTPLALFALRKREGRQVWLAALVFALPYIGNISTRFLIPVVPFLALALAFAASNWASILVTVAVVHVLLSWPTVVPRYSSQHAWLFTKTPWRAALRVEPEERFLKRKLGAYPMLRLVETLVPPGERVFSCGPTAASYSTHEILVSYTAAFNEGIQDLMWQAFIQDFKPRRRLEFHFAPVQLRKIRMVQTGASNGSQWSLAEVQFSHAGVVIPHAPAWHVSAGPNPWDADLAFDGKPITRWRSWESVKPGMHVDVDFGSQQMLDTVVLQTSNDSNATVRVEGESGSWHVLSRKAIESAQPIDWNTGRAATAEVKRRGIRYVLVVQSDWGYQQVVDHATEWGMRCIAQTPGSWLYVID